MKNYQPKQPDSWSDYELEAIQWYSRTHNLSLTNSSNQNPLVYYRTRAGLLLIKHIDDVVDIYAAAQAPQLAGAAA